jgi:hypothetical protein
MTEENIGENFMTDYENHCKKDSTNWKDYIQYESMRMPVLECVCKIDE